MPQHAPRAAQQVDAAHEAGASVGASLLIHVLGRQEAGVRLSVPTLAVFALVACDTMISNRVIIKTPADSADVGASEQEALAAVRATLASCGFKPSPEHGDLWVWHDKEHPPDVHATVSASWNQVAVHLEQGLFGPIGPTEQYRAVKAALLEGMRRRYGKRSVWVK
jgi:hypothetical protein